MISLIINGLIITLLAGTVYYIYIVDTRVRKLLSALNALEPMVGQFSEAVDKSKVSLQKFKTTTSSVISDAKQQKASKQALKEIDVGEDNKTLQSYVERVSLPEKHDLVRSFFETARKSEQ